jgi:hypothetical protein
MLIRLLDNTWGLKRPHFEFVDLSQFLRQNFENNVEQRPSNLEVINGKLVLQQRVKKNQEHR